MESELITRTFDFCLKFCHLTLFSPHSLPPTSLLTEPNRCVFISVFPIVRNQVFLKIVSMGLARHDLHGSAISFELSFSDLFVSFCFVS